jgi:hypothetical protein
VAAASAALVYHCLYLAWTVVDDAAISTVYGMSLFQGFGFRANPVSQPVEAFSSPLWTLLLGLCVPLHLPPIPFTRFLGIGFGALTLPALALWGPAAEGRRLRLDDTIAPLLVAAAPSLAGWTSSGMETGLQTFTMALAGALVLQGLRTGRGFHAGWALGLVALTRPEGGLYVLAAGVVWLAHRSMQRRLPGRQEAQVVLWAAGVAGSWLLFRWVYFADVVPNTYWAKHNFDFDGKAYLTGFLDVHRWLWMAALGGAVVALAGGAATARRGVLALSFVACACAFAWKVARGDWMTESRFLVPAVPMFAAALGAGLSVARRPVKRLPLRIAGWAAGLCLLVAAGYAGHQLLQRVAAVKAAPQFPFTFVENRFQGIKARLDALGQRRPLIAYPDLGGQAMVIRNAEILDVAGLADRAIAVHNGNMAATDDYMVSEGPPVLLDAHGPSGHFAGLPRLRPLMQELGGGEFQLRGLTPDEDPRCPEGKQRLLATPPAELEEQLGRDIATDQTEHALRLWRCATAYLPDERMPSRQALRALSKSADERSRTLEQGATLMPALRQASLATLLADGAPHLRRRTEALRAQLFPPPLPK